MPSYPHHSDRPTLSLDGLWDFGFLGETDVEAVTPSTIAFDDRMAVPGCFDAAPRYAGRRGVGTYARDVSALADAPHRLRIGAAGLWMRVYLDDEALATHRLPYSPMEVVVPAARLRGGPHRLTVVVDNRFDFERSPLFEPYFDFHAYGGVFRSVTWQALPDPCRIDRVRITTVRVTPASIEAAVTLVGQPPAGTTWRTRIDAGESFAVTPTPSDRTTTDADGATLTFRHDGELEPWSPGRPVLHTLTLEAWVNGEKLDAVTERFGVRSVTTRGRDVCINGEPVKLKGVCRHEAHPHYGPALPLDQLVADAQLIASLGGNFVRGSHYPQDPRFLDLCDELGLLVFEESLGWGQHKPEAHFANDDFADLQVQQTRRMVLESYNHPSVIMWGFLNEGGSKLPESRSLYQRLTQGIRDHDATRPVTYATMFLLEDLNLDLCDIVSVNTYPAWYAADATVERPLHEITQRFDAVEKHLHEQGLDDRPLLISEIGAGAIYGWRDPHAAHWSEEYQRDHLALVCREVMQRDTIAGVALWQFCDCRTYSGGHALKRPRAFNNKGIFDEYRRPKLAADAVRAAFERVDPGA